MVFCIDGRVIAMKQLSVTSHQGKNQFLTEIATISTVQHCNFVKLYGCCIEGDKRLLVYEYLENKSLDQVYLVCEHIFAVANCVFKYLFILCRFNLYACMRQEKEHLCCC